MASEKLKVGIDARLDNPRQGIGTAIIGLAKGFGSLPASEDEYWFIMHSDNTEWLRPYMGQNCRIFEVPRAPGTRPFGKRTLRQRLWKRITSLTTRSASGFEVAPSSVEEFGFDVIHFTTQLGFVKTVPTIYQPWDLQHLHLPKLFSRREWERREREYRFFCEQACLVCVQTEWGKRDLCDQYGLPESKVVVVPGASVLQAYTPPTQSEIDATLRKHGIPSEFFFYPAVTWPHKNHSVLLRALAKLKEEHDYRAHLVLTGDLTTFSKVLRREARQYGISDQVSFLGFVSAAEIQCFYRRARALVFPSKFEGWGFPIFEAFQSGLPVICSNASVLPEVTAGAASLLPSEDAAGFAHAMIRVHTDVVMRAELVRKGFDRVQSLSWERTADIMQKHYASLAHGHSGMGDTVPLHDVLPERVVSAI